MQRDKEPYTFTEWTRVAPKWKFWNKQETATISCTAKNCEWTTHIHRRHNGALAAHASSWGLQARLILHTDAHKTNKKKVS